MYMCHHNNVRARVTLLPEVPIEALVLPVVVHQVIIAEVQLLRHLITVAAIPVLHHPAITAGLQEVAVAIHHHPVVAADPVVAVAGHLLAVAEEGDNFITS